MIRKGHITLALIGAALVVSNVASAEEAMAAVATSGHNYFTVAVALALAAGFGLAFAVIGGAISQSKAATAALEGIARNPGAATKVQTPMIIGLALIESLVIYALVISFFLQGNVMKVLEMLKH